MPTTKVAIRARVRELDAQVQSHKATLVHQQDERQQLVQDCAQHGGHVPKEVYGFAPARGIFVDHTACEFCGVQVGASVEQLARNLVRMG